MEFTIYPFGSGCLQQLSTRASVGGWIRSWVGDWKLVPLPSPMIACTLPMAARGESVTGKLLPRIGSAVPGPVTVTISRGSIPEHPLG